MSNAFFRFKEFLVEQQRCAMKVTTDACIQGGWTPVSGTPGRILDIGTGTGLLSLMLAQRSPQAHIDAIEYDAAAAAQAADNFAASPWSARLQVITADVCSYDFTDRYDLIISNPPFFNNSLLSGDKDKDRARHTISLSYESLLGVIDRQLAPGGCASVLLPYPEYQQWKALLDSNGWHEQGRLLVKHTAAGNVNRVVCIFGKKPSEDIGEHTLIIKDADGSYTAAFTAILSPFYLHM